MQTITLAEPKVVPTAIPGKIEPVFKTVENPYKATQKEQTIDVLVNVAGDIVENWFSKGAIDGAQYAAAFEIRKLWEISKGGARAIDYARPQVDGGEILDPYSERSAAATKKRNEAARFIGDPAYNAVIAVVCENIHPRDCVKDGTSRQVDEFSAWVRRALSHLVDHWGLVAEGKR